MLPRVLWEIGERKKPINIKNLAGHPLVCVPSVPGTFCPFSIDLHTDLIWIRF